MKKLLLAISAGALLLTACADAPVYEPEPEKPEPKVTTAPIGCSKPRQCEAMWLEAKRILPELSGMKLYAVTTDYLETYQPQFNTGYDIRLYAKAFKRPTPGGSYIIEPDFYYDQYSLYLKEEKAQAVERYDAFNRRMAEIAQSFQ